MSTADITNITANTGPVLIVVDVQNDFCEPVDGQGGALGVARGHEVADRISRFLTTGGDLVAVSAQDWHPPVLADHFAAEGEGPDWQTTWPAHCVASTFGAELHPALPADRFAAQIRKGQDRAAYSGFEGTAVDGRSMVDVLDELGARNGGVWVCGIATDHCVAATVRDALAVGYDVTVLADLCAPVTEEGGEAALVEMAAAGATVTTSTEVRPVAA